MSRCLNETNQYSQIQEKRSKFCICSEAKRCFDGIPALHQIFLIEFYALYGFLPYTLLFLACPLPCRISEILLGSSTQLIFIHLMVIQNFNVLERPLKIFPKCIANASWEFSTASKIAWLYGYAVVMLSRGFPLQPGRQPSFLRIDTQKVKMRLKSIFLPSSMRYFAQLFCRILDNFMQFSTISLDLPFRFRGMETSKHYFNWS